MPRREGQDRDGLSVSIEDSASIPIQRRQFEAAGHRACQVRVHSVREVKPLDVVLDPTRDDPFHALIVGFPDRTLGIEQLAMVERLAQELSRRATLYEFPPGSAV